MSTSKMNDMYSGSKRSIYRIGMFKDNYSMEDYDYADDYTEPKCFCGFIRITLALRFVALLRMVLDLVALYCAWGTIFEYFLLISSLGTFTVLCIIISGLQEENHSRLKYTKLWVAFKLAITMALIVTVAIAIYEGDFDLQKKDQITAKSIVLAVAMFILMGTALVQWYLTEKSIKYLLLRDELYTIPPGEFKWQPELFRPQIMGPTKY
uniref:Uncharacterized protein n=1 Tax=Syphacia muris TaxID=451379 RepID=A0A158R5J5_9BILA